MATISASPAVARGPLSWGVQTGQSRPVRAVDSERDAGPQGGGEGAFGEPVPWRILAAMAVVFTATLAFSGMHLASSVAPPQVSPVAVAEVESGARPAHTVVTGETLWSIATRVDTQSDPRVTVTEIRELNRLSPSHVLQVGEVLLLPAAQ